MSAAKSLLDSRWKRIAIFWGVVAVVLFVIFLTTWNTFFEYVPPGQHMVVIAKDGTQPPTGHILADPGQKGPLREVKGEGWHFVMPIIYDFKLEPNTVIPAGKVGVVTAQGGDPLDPGQIIALEGQQGIQRDVLPPGSYRINLQGFKVDLHPAIEITAGDVGVQRRLQGKEGTGIFAEKDDERGYLREVLHPGLYYLNPHLIRVMEVPVGIFQTTFAASKGPNVRSPIAFTSRNGFDISVDCTVEWEIMPEDMPRLLAEYESRARIEDTVIDLQTHAIGRDRGSDYGIQDLLEGTRRQKYQEDFTADLVAACKAKNVKIHSAFIRNINFPPEYLKTIRERQISTQKTETSKAKQATAQTLIQVEEAKQNIEQEVKKVDAETKSMVAVNDGQIENLKQETLGKLEQMRAENLAIVTKLNAQADKVLGEAKAEASELEETAKSSLFQMKMSAFQNDSAAFLKYSLAKDLNPELRLRLFQSGPGTFWTNMEGSKGMNLMINPVGNAEKATTPKGK